MLFALGHPVMFAGLVLAFLLALALRAIAVRLTARRLGLVDSRVSVLPSPREDIDPFGAVAVAVGGAGWGKVIDVDEVPRRRGRIRAAAVFAAGPVVTLVVSQIFLLLYAVGNVDPFPVGVYRLSDILRGQLDSSYAGQILLALAGGLLAFGLLALLPIPPLDGFGLLWSAMRRPGHGMQQYRLWFEHKNLGVVVLLACCFFPLSYPLLLWPLDLMGTVFMQVWG